MTTIRAETKTAAPEESVFVIDLEQSVFRAFEHSEFLEWPSWARLRKILGGTGGCFGISGPRGAGKSWLMLRAAIADVRGPVASYSRSGLGLWYPSPSEYDPLAFLASLSDSLATEIDRRYRRPVSRPESARTLLDDGDSTVACRCRSRPTCPRRVAVVGGVRGTAAVAAFSAVGIFILVRRRALQS